MMDNCLQCGGTHVIENDHMKICDDCLSTIVLNDDGTVFAEYSTNASFREAYAELKGALQVHSDNLQTACRVLLSRQPDIPPLLNLMGMSCIEKERYGDAIKVLKQALELNPLYATACYNLAMAYHYSGYNDLAVKYFEQATKMIGSRDERYADIMSGCALALADMGRWLRAEDCLEKAEAHGFTHGEEVRLEIESKKREADEIPGTGNRKPGRPSQDANRNVNSSSNTQPRSNNPQNNAQQNGAQKPLWPYYIGIVILVLVIISGEASFWVCFVCGGIIYALGTRIAAIKKGAATNNTDQQ